MSFAMALALGALVFLVAPGCAKAPALTETDATAALDGWLDEQMKPFFQMLGQQPPPPSNSFRVSRPPPDNTPTDPNRTVFAFSNRGGMLMIKAKERDQFIGTTSGGRAEFQWTDGAWYLVRVEFNDGIVVEDIRWKAGKD